MRTWLPCLLVLVALIASAGETWRATILHTNDLHGELLPLRHAAGADVGGLARRATAIAGVRAEEEGRPVILIDAGDVFTRGPWHTRFYGEVEVEAMNLMGYDVACLGNNEFKAKAGAESQAILWGLVKRSRFPWLCANITLADTGDLLPGLAATLVREYAGVRVGFIGLTAPRVATYAQAAGLKVADPVAVARRLVPELRKECDIVVAVTHIGVGMYDRRVAREVPGIDVVIGGDSHERLTAPEVVAGPDGRKVPVVQAWEAGVVLGRLDIVAEKMDGGWQVTKFAGKLIPIDASYAPDAGVAGLIQKYLKPATLAPVAPDALRAAA